jgi:hypothetical protein
MADSPECKLHCSKKQCVQRINLELGLPRFFSTNRALDHVFCSQEPKEISQRHC